MRIARPVALVVALGACAAPPAFTAASFIAEGISYALSGKSIPDHGLSMITQMDCAMLRVVKDGYVCRTEDSGEPVVVIVSKDEEKEKAFRVEEGLEPEGAALILASTDGAAGASPTRRVAAAADGFAAGTGLDSVLSVEAHELGLPPPLGAEALAAEAVSVENPSTKQYLVSYESIKDWPRRSQPGDSLMGSSPDAVFALTPIAPLPPLPSSPLGP